MVQVLQPADRHCCPTMAKALRHQGRSSMWKMWTIEMHAMYQKKRWKKQNVGSILFIWCCILLQNISKTHGNLTCNMGSRTTYFLYNRLVFSRFHRTFHGMARTTSIPVTLESLIKLSCVMCTCKMRDIYIYIIIYEDLHFISFMGFTKRINQYCHPLSLNKGLI